MKFELYKEISSLKEYILVEPEKILIDIYRRGPNKSWEMEHYTARNKTIKIKALNITLPISEIYAHVDLMPNRSTLKRYLIITVPIFFVSSISICFK